MHSLYHVTRIVWTPKSTLVVPIRQCSLLCTRACSKNREVFRVWSLVAIQLERVRLGACVRACVEILTAEKQYRQNLYPFLHALLYDLLLHLTLFFFFFFYSSPSISCRSSRYLILHRFVCTYVRTYVRTSAAFIPKCNRMCCCCYCYGKIRKHAMFLCGRSRSKITALLSSTTYS